MSDQPVTRPTKAVIAGVVALTGSLAVAAVDNAITLGEALVALATTAAAVGAVYGVTNKPVDDGGDPNGGGDENIVDH